MLYHYEGVCPATGEHLSLPRSPAAMSLAHELMTHLGALDEGKMFGVLLVDGSPLYASSGLSTAENLPGLWVPTIELGPTPSEQATITRLDELKQRLTALAGTSRAAALAERSARWEQAQAAMLERHREAKALRQRRRETGDDPTLDSQRESRERRLFNRAREEDLAPLREQERELSLQVLELKRERKELSRSLQRELHAELERALFQGAPWSLASLFPDGPPTGVGECCAPKLLHYAARHGLQPLGLAEFWWGPPPPGRNRTHGQFYGACAERCQPLLGALLSGLRPLRILYEDASLLAMSKPPGVLTVPGRVGWKQDSLLVRLSKEYPELLLVHRLDLETSGVLLFARNLESQSKLQAQFALRTVEKIYEALLERTPAVEAGCMEQPLAADPSRPGCYRTDPSGKPARTRFRLLDRDAARIEFRPQTGRSHQLRVHAAAELAAPIRGDRLYGTRPEGRLMLHARRLECVHPALGTHLVLEDPVPF
jgi:tRNA pseudouridine32 synthase/23S rRNA pseudouridine746 synthase